MLCESEHAALRSVYDNTVLLARHWTAKHHLTQCSAVVYTMCCGALHSLLDASMQCALYTGHSANSSVRR
jgi:hypothetical protein